MVNTISNVCYNAKEREKLSRSYEDLHAEWKKMLYAAYDIEDDAEYEEALVRVDEFHGRVERAWRAAFAAQFSNVRNEWFKRVVSGLPCDVDAFRISKKQYDCFRRYVSGMDDEYWRSNKSYCRCEGKLIWVAPIGTGYYMQIRTI